jgi:hypothetical protein
MEFARASGPPAARIRLVRQPLFLQSKHPKMTLHFTVKKTLEPPFFMAYETSNMLENRRPAAIPGQARSSRAFSGCTEGGQYAASQIAYR